MQQLPPLFGKLSLALPFLSHILQERLALHGAQSLSYELAKQLANIPTTARDPFEFRVSRSGEAQRFAPAPSRAREKDRAREVLVKLDSITVPVITARSACLEPRV